MLGDYSGGKVHEEHRIEYYVGAASPRTAASTDAVSRCATESDSAPTNVPGSGAAPGAFTARESAFMEHPVFNTATTEHEMLRELAIERQRKL